MEGQLSISSVSSLFMMTLPLPFPLPLLLSLSAGKPNCVKVHLRWSSPKSLACVCVRQWLNQCVFVLSMCELLCVCVFELLCVCVCQRHLVVGVLQLPVVDPAVQEVEDGVGHQAEDVLDQRPHLGVARLPVGMDRGRQLAPLPPCAHPGRERVPQSPTGSGCAFTDQ